jgi:hypothetical protein
MWYDSKKPIDIQNAKEKFNEMVRQKKVFEIKEQFPLRSIDQNSYLHLILSWFSLETGFTLKETKKDIFKKLINPDLFCKDENGKALPEKEWKSTAKIDTAEMTLAIERFRNYSSIEGGIYLPDPTEKKLLEEVRLKIQNNKMYL